MYSVFNHSRLSALQFSEKKTEGSGSRIPIVSAPVKSERIIYLFFKADKDQTGNEKSNAAEP
jgi:hypothetical protein